MEQDADSDRPPSADALGRLGAIVGTVIWVGLPLGIVFYYSRDPPPGWPFVSALLAAIAGWRLMRSPRATPRSGRLVVALDAVAAVVLLYGLLAPNIPGDRPHVDWICFGMNAVLLVLYCAATASLGPEHGVDPDVFS